MGSKKLRQGLSEGFANVCILENDERNQRRVIHEKYGGIAFESLGTL